MRVSSKGGCEKMRSIDIAYSNFMSAMFLRAAASTYQIAKRMPTNIAQILLRIVDESRGWMRRERRLGHGRGAIDVHVVARRVWHLRIIAKLIDEVTDAGERILDEQSQTIFQRLLSIALVFVLGVELVRVRGRVLMAVAILVLRLDPLGLLVRTRQMLVRPLHRGLRGHGGYGEVEPFQDVALLFDVCT